jgi:hypothetical protein
MANVRRELLILPVLAILFYVFRVEIIGLVGINLGQATFLGVPLVTDWASIGLLLIFASESCPIPLVTSSFGCFQFERHLPTFTFNFPVNRHVTQLYRTLLNS